MLYTIMIKGKNNKIYKRVISSLITNCKLESKKYNTHTLSVVFRGENGIYDKGRSERNVHSVY